MNVPPFPKKRYSRNDQSSRLDSYIFFRQNFSFSCIQMIFHFCSCQVCKASHHRNWEKIFFKSKKWQTETEASFCFSIVVGVFRNLQEYKMLQKRNLVCYIFVNIKGNHVWQYKHWRLNSRSHTHTSIINQQPLSLSHDKCLITWVLSNKLSSSFFTLSFSSLSASVDIHQSKSIIRMEKQFLEKAI